MPAPDNRCARPPPPKGRGSSTRGARTPAIKGPYGAASAIIPDAPPERTCTVSPRSPENNSRMWWPIDSWASACVRAQRPQPDACRQIACLQIRLQRAQGGIAEQDCHGPASEFFGGLALAAASSRVSPAPKSPSTDSSPSRTTIASRRGVDIGAAAGAPTRASHSFLASRRRLEARGLACLDLDGLTRPGIESPLGKGHAIVMEASSRVMEAKSMVAADTCLSVS